MCNGLLLNLILGLKTVRAKVFLTKKQRSRKFFIHLRISCFGQLSDKSTACSVAYYWLTFVYLPSLTHYVRVSRLRTKNIDLTFRGPFLTPDSNPDKLFFNTWLKTIIQLISPKRTLYVDFVS